MAREFKLPDLGEGIHEAEILRIFVSRGTRVAEGERLIEVETDKAAVEIPSPCTATIEKIHVEEGDIVTVGDTLITFGDQAGADGEGKRHDTPDREKLPSPAPAVGAGRKQGDKRAVVPASPATRRLARELGVDLHAVPGSGPAGLVTAGDVRSAAENETAEEQAADTTPGADPGITAPPLPDFSRWGEIETIPVRSLRRATARQMALAWSQIPHVSNHDTADITRLENFRQKQKRNITEKDGKLTLTVFALKAAATALKAFPGFNASFDAAGGRIILKKYYHIGVAVDTDAGLMVPVIRDVDRKSIADLAVELARAVVRARNRELAPEDMQGGTFTITNAGAAGGGHFSPIINYPQVGILGLGQARMRPHVVPGGNGAPEIAPRLTMPVVFCFDHRAQDGVNAIGFTRMIIDALEDPDVLFLNMA